MPVPKRKRSRARRDSRFANKGIKVKALATCAQCKEAVMPHQVCLNCGYYKGRKIMVTKAERGTKRLAARTARDEAVAKRTGGEESNTPPAA